MRKYFIEFGEKTNLDFDLKIITRPVKPSAELEYEEINIPGGETLYKEKYYKDIEISISFNFLSSKDQWEYDYRHIKKWLNTKGEKLRFSDDLDVFYRVKKVKIDTPERILKRIGRFNVTFTCSPYVYFLSGLEERALERYIINSYDKSKPIYIIRGEGNLNLNVNGSNVIVNVGQELTINTELGLCFREYGMKDNVALNGRYSDLELNEGRNYFSFSEGFEISIIPNWRCLN